MEFFQQLDYMLLLKAFIVGGLFFIIGQILIDKTKLTSARILVIFVTAGAILGGLGIYQHIVDFAEQLHPVSILWNLQTDFLQVFLDAEFLAVVQFLPELAAII